MNDSIRNSHPFENTEKKQMQDLLHQIRNSGNKEMSEDIERIEKKVESTHKNTDFLESCIYFLTISVEDINSMEKENFILFTSQCSENEANHVVNAFTDRITGLEFGIRPLRLLELCKALNEERFLAASKRCLMRFEKMLDA